MTKQTESLKEFAKRMFVETYIDRNWPTSFAQAIDTRARREVLEEAQLSLEPCGNFRCQCCISHTNSLYKLRGLPTIDRLLEEYKDKG